MDFKKFLPHLIAIIALMLVSAVYFAPNAFKGKVLQQPDNDKARAMQTETRQYLEKEGKAPLWTNSPFGGMPAYQIYSSVQGNLTKPVYKSLFLWADYTAAWTQVFVAMFCMYLLLSVLKTDWRVAIFGALAFGITSYNVDILEAGHSTKMAALALAPGVLAGAVLLFNGRLWLGAGLLAMFVAMQLYANHVQITYYSLLLVGIYFLAQLADAFRHKTFANWGKAVVVTGLALVVGFACNLSRLWPTWEYSKETIRGKSELQKDAERGDGLNKDYLFGWSYGIGESLTLLVPHAKGGGAGETIQSGKFFDMVARGRSAAEKEEIGRQLASTFYWGDQPFVGTAIYFGAIVCFLSLLGAFLVPGSTKWWFLAGGLLMVSLAWGKNFFLNHLLYDYFPMFNKFRAVSMAMGLGQLCFAALAALGLQKFCDPDIDKAKKRKALYAALGTTALTCLLLTLFTSAFYNVQSKYDDLKAEKNKIERTLDGLSVSYVDERAVQESFKGKDPGTVEKARKLLQQRDNVIQAMRTSVVERDKNLAAQINMPNLPDVLKTDRLAMARTDAYRSLTFILVAFALLWLYLKGSLKASLTVGAVALLALADHWFVCNRTLDSSNYVDKKEGTAPPKEEAFDTQIKQDKDLHYRVLDYARGKMTTNWDASYFHKSLSGYHAAKLQRYQDVVDKYFGDVYPQDERLLPGILQLAGLFNVKYLLKPSGELVPNAAALGNAWFVKGWKIAPNGDEELNALSRLNFRDSAVVQQSFASALEGLNIQPDSNATIRLTAYHPDKMEYEYSAATEQLALFSEMWYPPAKGWKCYLNGQPAPDFFKADYLLRAMRLPAGQNQKLEMRFEPRSFYLGETISMAASVLALLLFFGGLFFWYRRHPLGDPNQLTDMEPEKKEKPTARATPPPVKGGGKKKK